MILIARTVGALALVTMISAALAYCGGLLALPQCKAALLAATLIWFGASTASALLPKPRAAR